jgi:transcriptional regulator with XRE-family HTH domain
MGRTIAEAINMLPPDRRAKVKAEGGRADRRGLSLQELRKAMPLTQAQLAERLGVRQDTISRFEQRADILLSILQGYVEAMDDRLAGPMFMGTRLRDDPFDLSGLGRRSRADPWARNDMVSSYGKPAVSLAICRPLRNS